MHIKLRHLLAGLFGLIALITFGAIGWNLAMLQQTLAESERNDRINQLSSLLLQAGTNNGQERGLTLVLLSKARGAPAATDHRPRLRQLRERDAGLQATIDGQIEWLVSATEAPRVRDVAVRLAHARQELAAMRGRIDACLAAPNCKIGSAEWLKAINGQIEALARVRQQLHNAGLTGAHSFAGNPLVREVLFTLIEYAGRERALVGEAIALGRPLTAQEEQAVHAYHGVIDEAFAKIDASIAFLPADSPIARARAAVRREYQERFAGLHERGHQASARNKPYPLSATLWFDAATAAIDTMIDLSTEYDRLAEQALQAARQEARRRQGLALVTVGGVILVLLAAAFVIRRRALQPLERLEQAAHTIAGGDLQQPLSGFQRDELGEVADAFETMRISLIDQMRQAYQMLRVVEQTDDMVIITDPQGVIEYVNAAFEKLTGYDRQEVLGQHTRLLKSGLYEAAFYRMMWEILTAGKPFRSPMTNRRKDGTLLFLEETITPLRDDTGITHYVCTAKDVTERREMDRRLQQSEKLASIGQLAAGVAHEINNPIGFVQANLGSLERYFGDLLRVLAHLETGAAFAADGSAWRAALDTLKAETDYAYLMDDIPALLAESLDGVERVRRIVQDLRDFSRVDAEQKWEMADLRLGLDSTLNIVNNEIKYRADVVKDYAEIPRVECLPAQLNQVFMNLLVNAAQAMPEGRHGTITLRCGSGNDEVWIEVADDGAGIAPEHLKKIFDPFFTTKPVGKGTGLGLALSYGIVEKHRGRIEVSSAPGRGTAFRVVLPLNQPAPAGKTASDNASAALPAPSFERT